MSHPLLTKVLADAWLDADEDPAMAPDPADAIQAAIPPTIADRLERALDVCQYPVRHTASGICERTEVGHRGLAGIHPYQPLVTP
jgi:hypothetical protein